jgi:hypothetical protein
MVEDPPDVLGSRQWDPHVVSAPLDARIAIVMGTYGGNVWAFLQGSLLLVAFLPIAFAAVHVLALVPLVTGMFQL